VVKKFELLNTNAKITLLLSLTELIINDISDSKGNRFASKAIEKCWNWLKYKSISAEELYYYLENLDEESLIDFLMMENNPQKEKVWICIANAFAYTTWEAYQFEEAKYLPQTIECVDFETIQQFFDCFREVYTTKSYIWENLFDLLLNNSSTSKKSEKFIVNNFLKTINN